ncbi:heterotrimeric G protein alpha subunit subtype 2 [Microthyrium microscopicum]|uniref:Guanine nucleotide-binding protein alpha-2 subunit n=1 Tax=Microthyrium microscopicum TaxID=703497 RepID=A0A6A6UFT3_9PEZI|nr:heterotrimeric G protein alpha subunit subtype 2 [Microthyrium microscopicum]
MCFPKKKSNPGSGQNAAIEKQIRADKRRQEKEVKILLLGAGESGKSTILKQMRLIHSTGFKTAERKSFRNVIFQNIVEAFLMMFYIMENQKTAFEDEGNQRYVELLQHERELSLDESLPPEYLQCFKDLWADMGIQMAILKGNEYALHDNLNYFFEDLDRIFARDWLPSDQDILRTRLRTTGINDATFNTGALTYKMYDVGGQRSERKKWIHVFDSVQVVMFLAAISGYDQSLIEDRKGNQMIEALFLFEQIANSQYFTKSALILFLNKIDLFKEKVQSGLSPITRTFPDYAGHENDIDEAKQYFAKKFKKLVKDQRKEIYTHYTNATDTNLLKVTMRSVQDMIVQKNLNTLIL